MTVDRQDRPGPTAGGRDSDRLAAQFVALAASLQELPAGSGVLGTVERVVVAARHLVEGADLVTVALRTDQGVETLASSDPAGHAVDALQSEFDEGPSALAIEAPGLGVAESADVANDPRFPRFGPAARELGVASVLSTGMFPGGVPPRFGTLNYWSRTPNGLGTVDRDHALVLAAFAATAISAVRAQTAADLRAMQLAEAVDSRDVIGQAKGILMERRGYSAQESFDVLRRTSQELNVKLRDIASTLVSRRGEL